MQGAEAVIATRFHNVVAALAVHVPVVSLGYAAKNDAVLDEMGLGEFAHRVEDFDVDTVLADLEAVTSRRDELVTGIAAGQARLSADCRRYLDDVVDGLAGRAGHGAARG
jgi:polysaccharide pyruvyl transferase WcaK-like protein